MITNALLIHLNVEQVFIFNTSSIIMVLKKINVNTLSNQIIQLNANTEVRLPSDLNVNVSSNSTVSLRVRFFVQLQHTSISIILGYPNTISNA